MANAFFARVLYCIEIDSVFPFPHIMTIDELLAGCPTLLICEKVFHDPGRNISLRWISRISLQKQLLLVTRYCISRVLIARNKGHVEIKIMLLNCCKKSLG